MAEERRPMPQITVRDPSRPDRPADVLVSGGDDRLPLDPAVKRRRLRSAGVVLLVGALAVGVVEWREQRAQAAHERRLGSVVELRAEYDSASAGYDESSGEASLSITALLHNDGPRDLTVTGGSIAGLTLVDRLVAVRAGRSARLLLERTMRCDPETPPTTPPGGLLLVVRTATAEREVEVELPVDVDEPARLCGFRPLEAMFVGFGELSRPSPDVVDLPLDLQTRAVGPVRLVAVVAAPGIAVELRVDGRLRGLPLDLRPGGGLMRTLSVALRLTVSDCGAALAPTAADLPVPNDPQGALLVQLADQSGSVGDALVGYPEGLIDSLVAESC